MNIGIVGTGTRARARAAAIAEVPGARLVAPPIPAVQVLPGEPGPFETMLAAADVVFVAVPTAAHFMVAEVAMKRGRHIFLEWPPATALREGEAMARLAEEAGVEAGVSRPLRYHPTLAAIAPARARLMVLRQVLPETPSPAWSHHLANAVDLCCALAAHSTVQHTELETVRRHNPWPEALAFSLRFHNGAFAQVSLHCSPTLPPSFTLFAAGTTLHLEADLTAPHAAATPHQLHPAFLAAETQAFLDALTNRRPAPVSVLDGLQTMRLVEALMQRLR